MYTKQKEPDTFNASIPFIEKILYSEGSCNEGITTNILTIEKNEILLEVNHTFSAEPVRASMPVPLTKEALLAGLEKMDISTWPQDCYETTDAEKAWELEFRYTDERPSVSFHGIGACPDHINALKKMLLLQH